MDIIQELLDNAIKTETDTEKITQYTEAKASYENLNTLLEQERQARQQDKENFVKKYTERFKETAVQQQQQQQNKQTEPEKPKGIKGLFK